MRHPQRRRRAFRHGRFQVVEFHLSEGGGLDGVLIGDGDAGALFNDRSIHGCDEFPVAIAQGHMVFSASSVKVPVKRLGAPNFFAVKKAANAGAVEMPIGRRLQTSDVAEGGKQIHTADGRALHSVWLDLARPSHDARHANAAFIHAALLWRRPSVSPCG